MTKNPIFNNEKMLILNIKNRVKDLNDIGMRIVRSRSFRDHIVETGPSRSLIVRKDRNMIQKFLRILDKLALFPED